MKKPMDLQYDETSGEIVNAAETKLIKLEPFVMVYPESFTACNLSGTQAQALTFLARAADPSTGIVFSPNLVLRETGIWSEKHSSQIVKQLVIRHAATRAGRGRLQLNPYVIWRGTSQARKKRIDRLFSESLAAKKARD